MKQHKKPKTFRGIESIQSQEKAMDHTPIYKSFTANAEAVNAPFAKPMAIEPEAGLVADSVVTPTTTLVAALGVPAMAVPQMAVSEVVVSEVAVKTPTVQADKKQEPLVCETTSEGLVSFVWCWLDVPSLNAGILGRYNELNGGAELVLPKKIEADAFDGKILFHDNKELAVRLAYRDQSINSGAVCYRYNISSGNP